MNSQSAGLYRVKAFVIVELIALVMALVLPLLPRRGSGELVNLPSDATGYFHDVLICFGLVNGSLVALVVACWVYWVAKGRPSSAADEATEASSSSDS